MNIVSSDQDSNKKIQGRIYIYNDTFYIVARMGDKYALISLTDGNYFDEVVTEEGLEYILSKGDLERYHGQLKMLVE